MNKRSKIYVAGHTGLVGSALWRNLQKQGYMNVIGKTHKELDLINFDEVFELFEKEKPEYVFLAAAKVGGIIANKNNPADFIYENMLIEFNVIRACYLFNVKRLMLFGSSCIYPKECPQPIKEEYLLTDSLEPTNEGYALAKIAGLKYVEYINEQYNKNHISVMPTNLYGINDNYNLENSHVIPALIRKIHEAKEKKEPTVKLLGTGKPLREFMFSDDLANICIELMKNNSIKGLINIGTGYEMTIEELAKKIKQIIKYDGKIEFDNISPDGTYRKRLDLSKIEELNLKAVTTMEKGLEITYKDFKRRIQQCK